jgi:PKD repeat protein
VRTAAPTPHALAQSLEGATGLAPSQVSQRDSCPPATAGHARCAAQVLVLRSSGAVVHPHVHPHPSLGRVRPTSRLGGAKPTAAPASSPPETGTPAFLQQAYDLSYLSQSGGAGDTVAIIDAYDDPTAAQDLATYRSTYGLPSCGAGCFEKVNESGQASPLPAANSDWQEEESLDLDAVSALCPNCHILLVEANSSNTSDLDAAMATAASMGASQISDSWTTSSSSVPSGTFTFPNVATVAATGDTGYVGGGQSVYPAASPGVTAAGGTSLAPASAAPNARGFGESAWSDGGSGCDLQEPKPAYQTDTGCTGRSYVDVSADADPSTGLNVYDSALGGWTMFGGTSLSTPVIASYYALTGITNSSAKWAYQDSGVLNDIVSGSNGTCPSNILYICNAGIGYDGPTGVGSISGAAVTGAPGIGGPAIASSSGNTYTESVSSHGATIAGGIYRNGLDTTWSIQYGQTTGYGSQTTPVNVGAGVSPVAITGYLSQLAPSTTYHYRLVAQNSLGTTYGYDYALTTAAAPPTDPTASFSASSPSAVPGGSVTFNAGGSTDSGGTITDYTWNFGDGTAVQDDHATPTASHTYTTRGIYAVSLTVTDSSGQTDGTTQTVTVDNPPTAAFTPSAALTTPGSAITFNAGASTPGSGGTITDYSWNFGDGTAIQDDAATATTSHTYTTPGTYTATLTATDDLGVSNSTSQTITVDQPSPAFTTTPSTPAPGTSINLDASSSTDPAGTITDYSWNFGDGTAIQDDHASPTASHTYTARGHYTITLTVTNNHGQTATATNNITPDNPPTAAFTPSTALTTPGSAITFNAGASTPGSGGTITDYSWNFGDGTAIQDDGATATTSHTYTTPGTYTATLTATDDLGVSNSTSQTITVDAAPTPSFTASSTTPAAGSAVSFDADSSSDSVGTITSYTWSFGDGSTAAGPAPTHVFAASGTYTVVLTVSNNAGQSATTSRIVTVEAPPPPAPTPTPEPAPEPAPTTPAPTSPPPAPPAPPSFSGRLAAARSQKLTTVLNHGLRLTVSLNQSGRATLEVTIPGEAPVPKGRRRATAKPAPIVLLHISGRAMPSGVHALTLKLSRSAAQELSSRGTAVLTVRIVVTDAYGTLITSSTTITLHR